jgi:uncharacterized protein (DUF362 family)
VAAALAGVAGQVRLEDVSSVLVKPNFVSVSRPVAATHVDAVRAVLDFIRVRYDGPVLVAEGAAVSSTWEGFRNFGYQALIDEYGVTLADLNADDVVPVSVYDRRLSPLTVYLSRTVVEAAFRVSVGPPKTHDAVVVTLSIKNMVMGALVNPPARGSSKMAMHQGFPAINLNLALVAPYVWPHLSVIDGWQGMEGRGPSSGDPVDWRVALAGSDPLAVDALTASLMGFDPEQVGYLRYCRTLGLGVGDLAQIDIVGNASPASVRRAFVPHPSHQRQLAWHLDGVERYLRPK